MNKFFSKVVAFILGMVFGFTALAGGITGGAYWAYKTYKPLASVSESASIDGLGSLETATVEELLNLLSSASNSPEDYDFNKLEKDYGFDVKALLASLGVDTSTSSETDLNAFKDISLFTLSGGASSLLSQVKLRSLYLFFPKFLGKSVDEILSYEAQNKLGDYTLNELLKTDETSGEKGIVLAIKDLKLGSLLPSVFTPSYSVGTHEYTYAVNDKTEFAILDLFANVSVETLLKLANGSDFVSEVMEGGLVSVGERSVEEVVKLISKSTDSNTTQSLNQKASAFGKTKIKDLFVKVEGEYQLSLDEMWQNFSVGKFLGYTQNADGKWFLDSECIKPVEGIQSLIANINIANVIKNKGDARTMLNSAFGNSTLGEIVNALSIKNLPKGASKLDNVRLSDILNGETGDVGKDMWTCFADALMNVSVGEFFSVSTESAVLKSIYNLSVGEIIKAKMNNGSVVDTAKEALNGVTVGDILGYKCSNSTVNDHIHSDSCIWYEKINVRNSDTNELEEMFVQVKSLDQNIASLTFSKIMEQGFTIKSLFAGSKLGDIIGLCRHEEYVFGQVKPNITWYDYLRDDSGNYVANSLGERATAEAPVLKLTKTIADIDATEFTESGAVKTIIDKLKKLKLGDLLEYTESQKVNENGETVSIWLRTPLGGGEKTEVKGIMGKLSSETLEAIEFDLDSIINVWKVGELLGFDKAYFDEGGNRVAESYQGVKTAKWFQNGTEITGIMSKLAGETVGEVKSDFGNIVDAWTIGDIFDESECENSKILKAIKNEKLSNVSNAINNVSLGEIMGFKNEENVWKNSDGSPVTDEITLVLVQYKIGHITGSIPLYDEGVLVDFSTHITKSFLSNVSVKTFFPSAGGNDGINVFINPDEKLGNLTTQVTSSINNAPVSKLIQLGIFGDFFDSPANYVAVDAIFHSIYPENTRASWLALPMNSFISHIMAAATANALAG